MDASTGLVLLSAVRSGLTRDAVVDEVERLEREFHRCDYGKPLRDCCQWVRELPAGVSRLGHIAMCERFRATARTQGCQEI